MQPNIAQRVASRCERDRLFACDSNRFFQTLETPICIGRRRFVVHDYQSLTFDQYDVVGDGFLFYINYKSGSLHVNFVPNGRPFDWLDSDGVRRVIDQMRPSLTLSSNGNIHERNACIREILVECVAWLENEQNVV